MSSVGYHDLHLHIVPEIDDGARDLTASLEILRGLHDLGYTHFVATPHADDHRFTYGRDRIEDGFAALMDAVTKAGLPIELRCGAEYTYGQRFHDDVQARRAMTLGGTRYVLLELPEAFIPATMPDNLFAVGAAGYYPVLAHPERCAPFQDDPQRLSRLAAGRALVQVSFRSLAGTFGRTIKRTAWALITEGIADLVATDCHSPRELKKVVRPVLKALQKRLDPSTFDQLMRVYPQRMLATTASETRD